MSQDQTILLVEQSLHQSRIGILLYLVKHSRQTLKMHMQCIKALDRATVYTYCEILHLIKYVLDARDYELRLNHILKKNET